MKERYNGPIAVKIGIRGVTVVRKTTRTIAVFWNGIYFFFTIFENHIPIDMAKPPINNATTTLLTPSQTAAPAAAPAPIVHRGQCALANSAKKTEKIKNAGIMKNFLFI